MYQLQLPLLLEPYRQQLESTARYFIRILPQPSGETTPWQSKIGGNPYLPKTSDYPVNRAGEPLFFLAQINFAEMPAMEPFPEEGIIQFYINNGGLLGWNEDGSLEQRDFRVLFFEEVLKNEEQLHQEFPVMMPAEELPIPPAISFPLSFQLQQEIVPLSDHQFVKLLGEDFFEPFGERQWDIMDDYFRMYDSGGHKIGGYAFFTQNDPRERHGDMELLFQLDTDKTIHCMWGDMGVGSFFIRKEDLEKRDFSKVLFNWDCY